MDQLLEVRHSHEGRRIDDIVLCEAHSDGHDHRDQREHQKQNYRWCHKQPSHPILLANYLFRFFSLFSLSHTSSPFRFVYVVYIIYIIYFLFLIFLKFLGSFSRFLRPILLICPYIISLFMICQAFFYINIYIISVISFYSLLFRYL